MFAGCSELTTLICPPTASWKADLDFSDCPNLTLESLNNLINDFLYSFDSGTHTITPNSTMWNALDGAVQDDIIARATAKGWTIAIPAQYSVTGTSAGSVVYATINGNAVEIDVVGENWSYNYNTPISSIAFTNDTNLQTIDFSLSDGLASLTSLDNAFKGCTMLTAVDFTNCDLTNVVSAADCFAACSALFNVTIPANSWKPDVDFSDCALIAYAEMADIINSLYTYASGTHTHTVTFNSTAWDALSVADQQTISDAADAKGWTTNSVAVVNTISGTSSAASETFKIQFIQDGALTPDVAETITVAVDGNGDWSYHYTGKKIYSLREFSQTSTTLTSVVFSEDFAKCENLQWAFDGCTELTTIDMGNGVFPIATNGFCFINNNAKLTSISLTNATFANVTNGEKMFAGNILLETLNLPSATFASLTNAKQMFLNNYALKSLNFSTITFAALTSMEEMFFQCYGLETINLQSAIFGNVTITKLAFCILTKLQELSMPNATFAAVTNADRMFSQYNTALLHTISAPNADFGNLGSGTNCNLFNHNYAESVKNLEFKPNTLKQSMDLSGPKLKAASLLNAANWCADLTGLSAKTITFDTSAWNALTSAEQATIQGILQSKNWNLATA
jgi:hypothetical protein